jgi:hypothetical protein
LGEAQLQGARFVDVMLQGALIIGANLQGARLGEVNLQGASLRGSQLEGAVFSKATVWRLSGHFVSTLIDGLDSLDHETLPWGDKGDYAQWRAALAVNWDGATASEQLDRLDPDAEARPGTVTPEFWTEAQAQQVPGEAREQAMANLFRALLADGAPAPFVARGLIKNGRLAAAGRRVEALWRDIEASAKVGPGEQPPLPGAVGLDLSELEDSRQEIFKQAKALAAQNDRAASQNAQAAPPDPAG